MSNLNSRLPSFNFKRWEISASTGSHFDVLDGLRGVAILLVVAFHTLYINPDHGLLARLAGYIIAAGWMGVPVFFVLSGFLISYPFFKKRETNPYFWYPRGYARRRLGKILPPFYLSILIFIGFYWWQFHDPAYLNSAWKWATGLGNFIPVSPFFNGVYWSLLVESHFYMVLPVLFWIMRGRTTRATTVVLFLILFAVPIVARFFTWPDGVLIFPDYHLVQQTKQLTMELNRFPCQLDYFAWGVAFAGVYVALGAVREQVRALSLFGYAGAAFLLVTMVLWGLWTEQFDLRGHPTRWSYEIMHLLPALATLLLLFFVFDAECLGARVLSCKPLRFTGIISYEWFLFHGPVVNWFHEHTGPTHGSVLAYAWRTIVPLALTFGFSVLVYRYFSLPILHRVRDSLKKVET
jgi:peptidoglycan/LPS O-acetylase OafA/YrhL